MATLKGLFDPKPRCQRNFLIENIKEVKTKSSSNSLKNKEPSNQSQKKSSSASSIRHLSQSRSHSNLLQRPPSRQTVKQASDDCYEKKFPQYPNSKDSSNSHWPCYGPPKRSGHSSRKPVTSARTVHYIHQENVPFEWTEVCPSLISHNICHQGVQTEGSNQETVEKPLRLMEGDDLMDSAFDLKDKLPPSISLSKPDEAQVFEEDNSPRESDLHKHLTARGEKIEEKMGFNSNIGNGQKEFYSRLPSVVEDFKNKDMKIELNGQSSTAGNSTNTHHVEQISNLKSSCLAADFENLKVTTSRKSVSRAMNSDPTLAPSSYQKGVIPRYLSKRKSEQALASTMANEIDPNCPPGHIVMPDHERRETLDMILKKYNDLIAELNKMPVRTDTLKMKQRKVEIEKQLDKFEEGIRIFSRLKVYVKLNS